MYFQKIFTDVTNGSWAHTHPEAGKRETTYTGVSTPTEIELQVGQSGHFVYQVVRVEAGCMT